MQYLPLEGVFGVSIGANNTKYFPESFAKISDIHDNTGSQ